jgi:hypothetical protein
VSTETCQFAGERADVRRASVQHGLLRLLVILQRLPAPAHNS